MTSKIKIGIILASTMVASAIVYPGVAHNHHGSATAPATIADGAAEQKPEIPKPAAGTALDANADANRTDANQADANQPDAANSANATAQATDSAGDSNQDQNQDQNQDGALADNRASASDSQQDSAPVAAIRRQTVQYAAAVVPASPVARVRMVRAVHPTVAVAAATIAVDHPAAAVTPVIRVLPSAAIVPTGAELTLRLDEPLGSKISQIDQSFSGSLDRDIDIDGHTMIPAGARVTGKVVFARPAGLVSGEASLKLEVTSVKVKNRELDVQTAVRAFGPNVQGINKVGRFMKGIVKRVDGEEREVLLEEQTAYTFNLSQPLPIR